MEKSYSMRELTEIIGKTAQSVHNLINKNSEFSSVVNDNKYKKGKNVFYGEPVLQWLMTYYGVDAGSEAEASEQESASREVGCEAEREAICEAEGEAETAEAIQQLEELRRENAALKEAVEALRADLERERKEKQQILEQHGIALLALRNEQEARQKYLPASKGKGFFRGLFSRNKE